MGRLEPKPIPRKDFLGITALFSTAVAFGLSILGSIKLFKPAVLPESQSKVKIGFAEDLPVDSSKKLEEKNLIVFHDEDGFYAMSLICTHLGCIVSPEPTGYKCPCHGSKFDKYGNVLGGPAPRPLEWFELSQAQDGQVVVDIAKKVKLGTHFNFKG